MTAKQKNLIVRTITGVLFVAIMVAGFLNAMAMIVLFSIITALTLWEYTGLVNDRVANVSVNRFIQCQPLYLYSGRRLLLHRRSPLERRCGERLCGTDTLRAHHHLSDDQ